MNKLMDGKNIPQKVDYQLIPKKILFGNADKRSVKISPDGQYISYLAPHSGVLNIYVAPINSIDKACHITNDNKRGITYYKWAYDNQHIIYVQDQNGDENWQIYSVNVETKLQKQLTDFPGVQAGIIAVSKHFPEDILIKLNSRKPEFHDIYKLNIVSGKLELIFQNDEFIGLIADDRFKLRFASKPTEDGGILYYKLDEKFNKELFLTIVAEDIYTTDIVGFNQENDAIYMIDSQDRNTAAVYSLNLQNNHKELIYTNDKVDVESILVHPTDKHIQAISYNYLKRDWHIIDQDINQDFDYLRTIIKGELNITSRSCDDRIWIVVDILDNKPASYYFYDRSNKEAKFLFLDRKELDQFQLASMHPVVITSRDGMELVSYLTLPVGVEDKANEFKPTTKVPLVLLVHGGPTARDYWGMNIEHQWLADRGYAVLSVNYRGSTGFGKSFINAGNGQWAGKMHDDLIDAVNWAIANDITAKDQVAIKGGSYGGYAALVGLTFTPDVFACGIDIVGPSNLITLINTIPPYWKPLLNSLKTKIGGDPETEEGRKILESKSPINYISNIIKPLLIAQGANDPRVKQSESDQIVMAMEEKKIPVTYILYPDEGHGFVRPENRISFYAVAEAFLAANLNGRFEKTDDDYKNSSIVIKNGKEFLPIFDS